jgi:uncharacterized protein
MSSIQPQQRIEVVDVLRGYALMGLFLIHMVEYFELYWHSPEPGPVNTWTFFFFGGKAYAMFALLFGVSFFIIMESQARKGVDFGPRFFWRLAVLFGIGFIHGLIYGGDILQILAVTGLILVPLYRRTNRTILFTALFFIFQGPAWLLHALANAVPTIEYETTIASTLHPGVFATYANGSFLEVLRVNLWEGQLAKWAFMTESGRIWNIIGLSLFGFVLARSGFFTDVARYQRTYGIALIVAGVFAALFTSSGSALHAALAGDRAAWIVGNIISAYANHAWIAVSLLTLMLLYHRTALKKVLRLLAPCGRISLTIYVSQAFLLVPFFYGYGAAAYAWIGQPASLVLGIVLWCLQVALAHYWIRNFYYGPFEWLWRSATWLRTDVPFRRRGEKLDGAPAPA